MDRTAYNDCMRPYMTGAATAGERQANMCIGAKICTGKASSQAEARHICETQPPKPPKEAKGANCGIKAEKLASCIIGRLEGKITSMETLREAVMLCSCKGKKVTLDQRLAMLDPKQQEALKIISQMNSAYNPVGKL